MLSSTRVFDSSRISVQGCCISSFYDQVYVGTYDGKVELMTVGRDGNDVRGQGQVLLPGGRPVVQVVSMGEIGLVYALSNGVVECIDSQRMKIKHEAKISIKGEVLGMVVNQDAQPDFAICLATSHKLHIYRWSGERHEIWKTLNIASPPVDLAWSRHMFCVAMEDQIVLIDLHSQNTQKVHEFNSSPKRQLLATSQRQFASGVIPILPGSKVTALSQGMFLMCVDSLGIIIKSTGEPAGNMLVWSSAPLVSVSTVGYVVSLHGDGSTLEVHSIEAASAGGETLLESHKLPHPAVAIIAPSPWNALPSGGAKGTKLEDLAAGGGVLFLTATPPSVYRLGTISLNRRLEQLFEEEDITGAFKLFKDKVLRIFDDRAKPKSQLKGSLFHRVSEDEDTLFSYSSREESISKFYADAGIAMLRLNKIHLAFQQFEKSAMDPRELIAYYKDLQFVKPKEGADFPYSPVLLRPISLLHRIASYDSEDALDEPTNSCQLIQLVRKTSDSTYTELYQCLLAWLEKTKLNQAKKKDVRRDTAIDVALFLGYLKLMFDNENKKENTKKLGLLCESKENHLDIIECTELLIEKGLYHQAALLFSSSEQHIRKALELWADIGSGKYNQDGQDGVSETVRFLSQHQDDQELVWTFSSWVLRESPIQGVEIFTSSDSKLAPARVLEHLEGYDTEKRNMLKLRYLQGLSKFTRDFDAQLAIEYIQVMSIKESFFENVHAQFKDFVQLPDSLGGKSETSGGAYVAELVIRRIDQSPIAEKLTYEKVDLFLKCGWHTKALDILVNQFGDTEAAERYCLNACKGLEESPGIPNDEDDPNDGKRTNPFLDLLCIYLAPENASKFRDASMQILERHGHRIDPTNVISKLPADIPLKDLQMYLSIIFPKNAGELSHLRIERNLCVAHNIKVRNQLMKKHKRNISITSDTRCQACNKPILTSAFALDPSQQYVLHYSCLTTDT